MWASAPTEFYRTILAERLFFPPPPAVEKRRAGVDFMPVFPYNKMEYEYGLLIRCNRCRTTPFKVRQR